MSLLDNKCWTVYYKTFSIMCINSINLQFLYYRCATTKSTPRCLVFRFNKILPLTCVRLKDEFLFLEIKFHMLHNEQCSSKTKSYHLTPFLEQNKMISQRSFFLTSVPGCTSISLITPKSNVRKNINRHRKMSWSHQPQKTAVW